MEDIIKTMENVLVSALAELKKQVDNLEMKKMDGVKPPLPRPKFFEIVTSEKEKINIIWPCKEKDNLIKFSAVMIINKYGGKSTYYLTHYSQDIQSLCKEILRYCDYQPRMVLRALRRIQAASEWCRRRAEGRRRAVEEILRQQQKAVEALETEAAIVALRG